MRTYVRVSHDPARGPRRVLCLRRAARRTEPRGAAGDRRRRRGARRQLRGQGLRRVGPVTAKKLRARGITTVGEVARRSEPALVAILGRAAGRHLHALAHNRDPRRVRAWRRRRSMGAQRALGRSPRSREALDAVLVGLVDRLARRLRAARRVCRTVVLRLRFADFSRATRSHTLAEATAQTQTILATARGLLAAAMPTIERQGITLVGVALGNLADEGAVQLALPL